MNISLGMPVVIINICLGSIFFATLTEKVPDLANWIGAVLALAGAVLSGALTYFNYSRQSEGHRRIANRYLALSRECQKLEALYRDKLIDLEKMASELEQLNRMYNEINVEAEAFPRGDRAFNVALKLENLRQEGLSMRYGREIKVDEEQKIDEAFVAQK